MKRMRLFLLMTCCVYGLQGMQQAEMRMREELIVQATRRLQVKEEYAKLRLELTRYSLLPVEQQARDKEIFLKTIDSGFKTVAKLERHCAAQNELEQAKSIRLFRAELNQGKIDLQAFEKIAQLSSVVAPAAGEAERKRDADAQQAGSERSNAERADRKAQEAEQAEADAREGDSRPRGGEDKDHTAEDLYEAGVAGVMCLGVKGLIRQGGKWVLKGSNPWIAGGLTAIEIYRLARYVQQRNKKS